MTLDEYVAWANRHAGGREDRALLEILVRNRARNEEAHRPATERR